MKRKEIKSIVEPYASKLSFQVTLVEHFLVNYCGRTHTEAYPKIFEKHLEILFSTKLAFAAQRWKRGRTCANIDSCSKIVALYNGVNLAEDE